MKYIILFVLFISVTSICTASEINIYYPNNNTTTDIFFVINDSFHHTIANNVSGNLSMLILDDEIEYDNILESPHKVISPVFRLILIMILFVIGLIVIQNIKRVFR